MIFISHRRADETEAKRMATLLQSKNVNYYLDVLDPMAKTSLDITKHIMNNLNKCTHVIVIFSKNTEGSMWVPFELGAAYKADKGIGTYLVELVSTPEYLNTFPKMKTSADIDKFVEEYKQEQVLTKSARYDDRTVILNEASGSGRAERFITRLKSRLGQ
ncbi:MAG: toll/interleukin-1 receptor domain-containing protein [Halobacteriovoraceae bacterium]|nr:toll/interleukin-1 receptor domain-containing protein [Halobacteriovoraceae bacterium]